MTRCTNLHSNVVVILRLHRFLAMTRLLSYRWRRTEASSSLLSSIVSRTQTPWIWVHRSSDSRLAITMIAAFFNTLTANDRDLYHILHPAGVNVTNWLVQIKSWNIPRSFDVQQVYIINVFWIFIQSGLRWKNYQFEIQDRKAAQFNPIQWIVMFWSLYQWL